MGVPLLEHLPLPLLYVLSVCVSFIAVALKGFQHKNVIGNHQTSIVITSYAMAAFDVLTISIIVEGGLPIAITSGTGAACGMIFAVRLHDWLFKREDNMLLELLKHYGIYAFAAGPICLVALLLWATFSK